MCKTKHLRERLGWSQQRMGEYLGLTGPSVCRIERGQKPRAAVEKLLALLEREIAEGKHALAPLAPATAPAERS